MLKNNCTGSVGLPIVLHGYSQITPDCGCVDNSPCKGGCLDSKCVFYTGPALNNLSVTTGEDVESIIIKLDDLIGANSSSGFPTYNYFCLDDVHPINTQKEFVEAASKAICDNTTALNIFVSNTFENYKGYVEEQLDLINKPGFSIGCAGIVNTDSLKTSFVKLANYVCSIDLNLSNVTWDAHYLVPTLPTTVAEGFSVILDQIGILKASLGGGGAVLTFNNVGSCLPSPVTTSDSLVDTINKIKTRLCTSPVFDINALVWGCIPKPSSVTTNLQAAFQAVLSKIDSISQNIPTFSGGDFIVSPTDPGNPCMGKTVSLASSNPVAVVSSTPLDTAPGTLSEKLQAGTNISLDYTTVPGTVIINSSGGASTDEKVKSGSSDPSSGYLIDKIETIDSSDGITLSKNLNLSTNTVDLQVGVNINQLWTALLDALDTDPALKAAFCEKVSSCLPDCNLPPDVTIIYNP